MVVEVGNAVHGVDHEHYLVGLLDGQQNLFVDFSFEDVVGVDNPAAGVDYRELFAVPVDLSVLAVARCSGGVVDDGGACAGQTVEEGRLSDIGTADYGYDL